MAKQPLYDLIDRIYDGGLAERLKTWRDEGRSLDAISDLLNADGLLVSRETIRTWLAELEAAAS